MRRLSGLLILTFLALGGVLAARPELAQWAGGRWSQIMSQAGELIRAEWATVEQIRSGKLKIGAAPEARPGRPQAPAPLAVTAPAASRPLARANKPKPPVIRAPLPAAASPQRPEPVAAPPPPAAAAKIPADAAPEAALGAILKHEIRENQAKEETFWTAERIAEALKNGAPKSKSSACLLGCGEENTVIEINMPKDKPADP